MVVKKELNHLWDSPNFTGRIDYFGVPNLKIGFSGFFGNSQSTELIMDSTIVGIVMLSSDLRYMKRNFQFKGNT